MIYSSTFCDLRSAMNSAVYCIAMRFGEPPPVFLKATVNTPFLPTAPALSTSTLDGEWSAGPMYQ